GAIVSAMKAAVLSDKDAIKPLSGLQLAPGGSTLPRVPCDLIVGHTIGSYRSLVILLSYRSRQTVSKKGVKTTRLRNLSWGSFVTVTRKEGSPRAPKMPVGLNASFQLLADSCRRLGSPAVVHCGHNPRRIHDDPPRCGLHEISLAEGF